MIRKPTPSKFEIIPFSGSVQFFSRLAVILFLLLTNEAYSQGNWIRRGTDTTKYSMGVDSKEQYNQQSTFTIQSKSQAEEGFGTLMQNITPAPYLGKRIRMSGYLKTINLSSWAGFWLRVDQAGSSQSLSFDNMQERPVKGTTNWEKYEIVLDVPAEASNISYGALMYGTGQIWFSSVRLEIVDESVPTTDLLFKD